MSNGNIPVRVLDSSDSTTFNVLTAGSDGYPVWSPPPVYNARGVILDNVADLTAFASVSGGTIKNGVTYVAGDFVLLANQTTAAQCGLYVVGTVDTNAHTAPLTRAPSLPANAHYVNGMVIQVSEGTLHAGSSWKAMCTGSKVIGTDDPLFYPKNCGGTVTLALGTKTLGSTQGLWLFSTTTSSVQATYNTPNTIAASGGLSAPVASRGAGKAGTAAVIINAVKAADDTVDTSNISTVDWLVTNW